MRSSFQQLNNNNLNIYLFWHDLDICKCYTERIILNPSVTFMQILLIPIKKSINACFILFYIFFLWRNKKI